MAQVEFKHAALHYIDLWLSVERLQCKAMSRGTKEEKLRALARFAYDYRVARNLSRENDTTPKYKPVLDIIDRVKRHQFTGSKLVPKILKVEEQISEQYKGRRVLSATTKFLWLKIKSPIILYDSRLRATLGTTNGDLDEYYSKWKEAYESCSSEIDAACQSLIGVREFMSDTKVTPNYVKAITSKRWFKKRVFDSYLWLGGRLTSSDKKRGRSAP